MNLKDSNTKKPTVVVIIPFYNGMKWIERAVESVHRQTAPPEEFIIVNDGSTPEERLALGRLSDKHHFKIFDKPNGGQGSARNAGVSGSKSDYICFLDQDDFYLEDHIETLIQAIPNQDCRFGWIYADLNIADEDGNIIFSKVVKERSPFHPKHSLIDIIRNDMFVLPSASIIGRKAFESVGGFDEQFKGYEDDDLFLRLFRKGYTNYFIDKAITTWCIHEESTTFNIVFSQSRLKYFKKLRESFPNRPKMNLYYLRDCIIPRFSPIFIESAVSSVLRNSKEQDEMIKIIDSFYTIIATDDSVSSSRLKKLKALIWVLKKIPAIYRKVVLTLMQFSFTRRLLLRNFPLLRNFNFRLQTED
jgi:glycosyltransferase involved in cell wall biosynthesis